MGKIQLDHTIKDISEKELQKLIINTRKLDPTKRYRVLFFDVDNPPTVRQHRYYRMLLKFVETETGNDREGMHKHLKSMFGMETIMVNNDTFEHMMSTAGMSRGQMSYLIDNSIRFIEETFGIECPRPDNVPPEFTEKYGEPGDYY